MPVSEKLAIEIFTIEIFHLIAVISAVLVMIYFWLKARRSALLYSFLCLIGMLLVWMISKILKTVSPNEGLRWFFIVTQYFGIEYTGYFFLIFSLIYTGRSIKKRSMYLLLAIPPTAAFAVVAANPIHMQFYAYFDFYRDTFGPWFFPAQSVQYLYVFLGVIFLSLGFTKQPHFRNRSLPGRILALTALIPIAGNVYYLLVKLTSVPFISGIPFFDFTPITSTFALILFLLPAFRYRFLDILPFAYRNVCEQLPDGLAVVSKDMSIAMANRYYRDLTQDENNLARLKENYEDISESKQIEMKLTEKTFLVSLYPVKPGKSLLYLKDISKQTELKEKLHETNEVLTNTNLRLTKMLEVAGQLSAVKLKTQIAQDIHDIFGHTLIVVLGLLDLVYREDAEGMKAKLSQAQELLQSGVLDIQLAMDGQERKKTTLEKAILSLTNDTIAMDFTVQGKVVELSSRVTDGLFRICQEAVTNAIKHGKASQITIILRFKQDGLDLYIIDNGIGCAMIKKNYGLSGMDQRVRLLGGEIKYGSDGETGFYIHLTVPYTFSSESA